MVNWFELPSDEGTWKGLHMLKRVPLLFELICVQNRASFPGMLARHPDRQSVFVWFVERILLKHVWKWRKPYWVRDACRASSDCCAKCICFVSVSFGVPRCVWNRKLTKNYYSLKSENVSHNWNIFPKKFTNSTLGYNGEFRIDYISR